VVSECGAQLPPAASGCEIERENAVAVDIENPVEPRRQQRSKIRVLAALQGDATLDLSDGDDADEKVAGPLTLDPRFDAGVPSRLGERRENVGIDQEH